MQDLSHRVSPDLDDLDCSWAADRWTELRVPGAVVALGTVHRYTVRLLFSIGFIQSSPGGCFRALSVHCGWVHLKPLFSAGAALRDDDAAIVPGARV